MTKKDYILLANVVRVVKNTLAEDIKNYKIEDREYALSKGGITTMEMFAEALSVKLLEDNTRFERAKFLVACGVSVCRYCDQVATIKDKNGFITCEQHKSDIKIAMICSKCKPTRYNSNKDTLRCVANGCKQNQSEDSEYCEYHWHKRYCGADCVCGFNKKG